MCDEMCLQEGRRTTLPMLHSQLATRGKELVETACSVTTPGMDSPSPPLPHPRPPSLIPTFLHPSLPPFLHSSLPPASTPCVHSCSSCVMRGCNKESESSANHPLKNHNWKRLAGSYLHARGLHNVFHIYGKRVAHVVPRITSSPRIVHTGHTVRGITHI